jgi:putative glutamine amidotransferase
VHRQQKGDSQHPVSVDRNSKLYSICTTDKGEVNSSHHQAIENTGRGLMPVAWSPDGLTEATELADAGQHPFFIGVQWHPERMSTGNPLSVKLGMAFLDMCHAGQKGQSRKGKNI